MCWDCSSLCMGQHVLYGSHVHYLLFCGGGVSLESQLTDPAQILTLLQVKEMKALCKSLNLPTAVTGSQKAAMISSVLRHQGTHRPLFGSTSFLCTASKK